MVMSFGNDSCAVQFIINIILSQSQSSNIFCLWPLVEFYIFGLSEWVMCSRQIVCDTSDQNKGWWPRRQHRRPTSTKLLHKSFPHIKPVPYLFLCVQLLLVYMLDGSFLSTSQKYIGCRNSSMSSNLSCQKNAAPIKVASKIFASKDSVTLA